MLKRIRSSKAGPFFFVFIAYILAVAAIAVGGVSYAEKPPQTEPTPETENIVFVGAQVCRDCHTLTSENWAHTRHAMSFATFSSQPQGGFECETCHGPGSKHVAAPDDLLSIIRFSRTSIQTPIEQNNQCLSCHTGGNRMHWASSIHETADLTCSDCHNPMGNISSSGLLARGTVNETCMMCHKEQRMDFNRRSHMPLFEGKIGCVDCHNPHGSLFEAMLKTPTVNETCFTCHAEKRGPFLFEHAPVSENCLNCHAPHGSNHEKLLTVPRPILCQQCHSMSGHMNDLFTQGLLASGSSPDPRLIGRSCQNCHSQVHGSNHPSGVKLHR